MNRVLSGLLAVTILFSFSQNVFGMERSEALLRKLLAEKEESVVRQREEVAALESRLEELNRALHEKDGKGASRALKSMLLLFGISGTLVAHVSISPQSARAKAVFAVLYLVEAAGLAEHLATGYALQKKTKPLKKSIEQAQGAIAAYRKQLELDEAMVLELRKALPLKD